MAQAPFTTTLAGQYTGLNSCLVPAVLHHAPVTLCSLPLAVLQPLHQSLLVEGHEEDEAEEAADDILGGDDEQVGLEPLLAQASEAGCHWMVQALWRPVHMRGCHTF